jgi:hypothetical protein
MSKKNGYRKLEKDEILPAHIRREIMNNIEALEKEAEYAFYEKDFDKAYAQFLALCDKCVGVYSIEAGTYIMKYVFCVEHNVEFIEKSYRKFILTPEWKRFSDKFGSFIISREPPGFGELVKIFNQRHHPERTY